jgi:hypothetical protein
MDHLLSLLMEAMTPLPLAAHTTDRSEASDD